jgi:UDP-N-acetylglucosamine--N-acetylmuramyl-(pentapeptide) pyrophosphoryl-undecaprenol N-acetylglucosamine transferase
MESDREQFTRVDPLWVGSVGGMEADLVKRAGVPFESITAAGVHGVSLRSLPGNLRQLSRGYFQARRTLNRFQPDALFFTGGYVAVPVALAGRRLPTLLYVPDIEPGLALKTLARFADHIALTAEGSRAFFPHRSPQTMTVTGYPTRANLQDWNVEEARRFLNLSSGLPTLLVFGGSSGARSINRAMLPVLPDLLTEMQVVHISGQLDWPEVERRRAALPPELFGRYRAFPYLHEMGAALRVADLALSRAGASVLGEFPLFGLPALLVPYPYAWRYQKVNAQYLVDHGAALLLEDADLPERLLPAVRELMRDRQQLEKMHRSMDSLRRPHAARAIAGILTSLAQRQDRERD